MEPDGLLGGVLHHAIARLIAIVAWLIIGVAVLVISGAVIDHGPSCGGKGCHRGAYHHGPGDASGHAAVTWAMPVVVYVDVNISLIIATMICAAVSA
jgi:hypothetical protein